MIILLVVQDFRTFSAIYCPVEVITQLVAQLLAYYLSTSENNSFLPESGRFNER